MPPHTPEAIRKQIADAAYEMADVGACFGYKSRWISLVGDSPEAGADPTMGRYASLVVTGRRGKGFFWRHVFIPQKTAERVARQLHRELPFTACFCDRDEWPKLLMEWL